MKVAILVSPAGDILDWTSETANTHDKHLVGLAKNTDLQTLSDFGFHSAQGDPENPVICQKGERNERMVVETGYNQRHVQRIQANDIAARTQNGFELAVASIFALFNTLLEANRYLGLPAEKPAIVHFCVV